MMEINQCVSSAQYHARKCIFAFLFRNIIIWGQPFRVFSRFFNYPHSRSEVRMGAKNGRYIVLRNNGGVLKTQISFQFSMSKREISQKALREGAADELNQDKS